MPIHEEDLINSAFWLSILMFFLLFTKNTLISQMILSLAILFSGTIYIYWLNKIGVH